ncbi:Na+/H+ antiporter subunit E [Actinomycetospora sp. TBRC 11914]|uniref:Na+/H+ antiporter subunit E n=1 Tax=Actinomycetospora sp. TBRC 11914 TaxID=2729387 RepID=UPI00145E9A81|nr:Na+/H+ antiporter subunit E [Actinomycetospora sp. TBRC 11914]NMO88482.1 hypothetical protein [Actinomycetospora sp. TBRC 11914]
MADRQPARVRRVTLAAVELVAWVVVLTAVWVATLTSVGLLEVVVAAVVSVPIAVLALAARRVLDAPTALPPDGWRWAARLPGAVVTDTGRLAVAVVRAVRSGRPLGQERRLPLADPPDAVPDARGSVGAVTISTTPGAYVADVRRDALVVHALSPTPSALERAVAR